MQIEKSVFISYRHTNVFHARAIFQDLRANGHDVFLDSESIGPGDFERIILGQIRARAHFLVLLTPSALERCNQPGDWLRREIETAIDEKRNIIPLMFEGFDFNSVQAALTGKLALLKNYNGLRIPAEFFDEAMTRLRNKYLSITLDVVLHPTPTSDQRAVQQIVQREAAQPTVTEQQLTASEYFERALKAQNSGDVNAAIRDYTEAIRLDPKLAQAYNNRGSAYDDKGEYDRTIADCTEAIRLDPKNAAAYNNRGSAYNSKGEYDRAIADYTEAIRLDPKLAQAYYNRGNAYNGKGEFDRAIADYTEALRLDPKYALAYNNRGNAYFNKRDYDHAIADCTEAIRLDPKYAFAYTTRGAAYHNKGEYAKARVDYEAALRIDPNLQVARQNLDILNKAGK